MAIAVSGTPTSGEATGTAALVVNVPSGISDGDFLVWVIAQGSVTTLTPPAGWTNRQTQASGGADSMHIWYRVASSEPASYSTGTRAAGRCAGIIIAYSGVDQVTPWDVASPAAVVGTTTTTCNPITPTTDGAWVLGVATGQVLAGVTTGAYTSSNTTVDISATSTTASTNDVAAVSHFAWTSGAFTPLFTCSVTTAQTVGGTDALRPSVAASDPSPQWAPGFMGGTAYPTFLNARAVTGWVPAAMPYDVGADIAPVAAPYVPELRRRPASGWFPRRRWSAGFVPPPVDPNAYAGVYTDVITSIPSLIGRWKLDDRTGTVAVATVGPDGAYVTTPTLAVSGLVADGGTAVTTDGVASEITVPVGTNQKAIVFWSSHGAGGGAGIPLMRDSTSSAGTGWFIDISGVNPVVRADGTNHTVSTVTASTLRDGLRHFYVLQYDGTNVTLFIDGSQVDTWVKVGSFPSSATNWHFGKNGTAANFYGGTFDDIGGFNSLLSTGQVRNLWVSGITPAYPNESRRTTRRFTVVVRRGHSATVVPAQIVVTPPVSSLPDTRRRLTRGFAARRRRAVEVVPAQIAVAAPSYVSEARRAARRFVATRRGRQVGVIPPQIPAPDRNRRRGLRGWVAVRDRSRVEVIPPQVVVAPPAYVPTIPAKHNLRGMQRRGRHVVVVPPQQAAPAPPPYVPAMPPRHALRGVPRRGRRADVPLAQTPAHRGQPRRPIRVLARKVRRAVSVISSVIGPATPLVPEVILYATVYDHTLTASTLTRTQTAASQTRLLPSTTRANTLTASTLDRTIEET